MHIITVTQKTTAKPQAIWGLWENVPERTWWDDSLERAQLRGPFQPGVRGVVKLKEQPERTFAIVDCVPLQEYTDLYWLPEYIRSKSFGNPSCERPDAYIAMKKLVELLLALVGNRYDWYQHKIREQLYFFGNEFILLLQVL